MTYNDDFNQFLGALSSPKDEDIYHAAALTSMSAAEEGADPYQDLHDFNSHRIESHRLQEFGKAAEKFWKYQQGQNEVRGSEQYLMSLDRAEGTTWRTEFLTQLNQDCNQAEQDGWSSSANIGRRQ